MRINLKSNITLLLISLTISSILIFLYIEIYIRLTKPYETPDSWRKESLEYEATLFSRHAFPKKVQTMTQRDGLASATINSKGYRGQEFHISKDKGKVRLIFLGGSAAFDPHAPEGRDWPHLVQKRLRAAGHLNVECINASTPGHASWDSLGRLYSEIWMFEPDYIFIYHAWNDIKYFKWLHPDKTLLREYRPASIVGSKDLMVGNPFMYYTGPIDRLLCLSQLYVRLRWRYWSWQLGLIGPEGLIQIKEKRIKDESFLSGEISKYAIKQFELNLRLICDTARNIGAVPVLMTLARLPTRENKEKVKHKIRYDYVGLNHEGLLKAFEECDMTIQAVGNDKKVAVLDLSEKLSGNENYFIDHVHTTLAGSAAIAREVVQFFDQILLIDEKNANNKVMTRGSGNEKVRK